MLCTLEDLFYTLATNLSIHLLKNLSSLAWCLSPKIELLIIINFHRYLFCCKKFSLGCFYPKLISNQLQIFYFESYPRAFKRYWLLDFQNFIAKGFVSLYHWGCLHFATRCLLKLKSKKGILFQPIVCYGLGITEHYPSTRQECVPCHALSVHLSLSLALPVDRFHSSHHPNNFWN